MFSKRRFVLLLAAIAGFILTWGVVGVAVFGILSATGNYEIEDAQIPVYPLAIMLACSVAGARFAVIAARQWLAKSASDDS